MFNTSGDFLQIGRGNVDDYKVMINGNVKNFPEKQTESHSLSCEEITADDKSVKISGHLLLGQEHDCPVHASYSLTFSESD